MSKRSHTEFSQGSSQGKPLAAKRAKTSSADAMSLVLQHSRELTDLLKTLQAGIPSEVPESLKTLSKTLLPAFEVLGTSTSGNVVARAVAEIEKGKSPSKKSDAKDVSRLDQGSQADSDPKTDASHLGNRIPPKDQLTAWKLSDIPESYPPLPPILDSHLEAMAGRHHGSRRNIWEQSYENLEFLGDAFIYHVASEIISQTFPTLLPGECSQLRERILRNSNLGQYSTHYGIVQRANLPAEFLGGGREGGSKANSKQREKVYGDLFEAYVGAMIHSGPQGVEDAVAWLRPLWAMTLADDIRKECKRAAEASEVAAAATSDGNATATDANGHALPLAPLPGLAPLAIPPKVQLSRLIGCKPVEILYKDEETRKHLKDRNNGLPLFVVAVHVNAWGRTEVLGRGTAQSKKDAGSKAAEQALQSKMMKFYTDKKGAYLKALEKQRELEV